MEEFEALKRIVAEAQADVEKVDAGNKAAGSRVRKYMMDIKKAAQDVREKVLAMRGGGEAPATQPSAAPASNEGNPTA